MKLDELFEALVHEMNTRYGDRHPIERDREAGQPCLKVAGKLFAVLDEGLVVRLPQADRQRALMLPGVQHWQRAESEGAIRDWVVIPAAHADQWADLAGVALQTALAEE